MTRHWRVLAVGILLLTAGCASAPSDVQSGGESESSTETTWSYSAGGSQTAKDDQGTFEAPSGEAEISTSIGGNGRIEITVEDASGDTVFKETFTGSGGSSTHEELSGSAGTWTVHVDVLRWEGGFSLHANGR